MKASEILLITALALMVTGGLIIAINHLTIWYGEITGADEISCNWLYCTITYKSEECYHNGTEIPCEKLKEMGEWT